MNGRRVFIGVVVATFVLIALVTKPYVLSWNDASRVATIDALVHQHTFAIENSPYALRTQDKYVHGGHTYSDKPPALALQGALVASAIAPLGIELRTGHAAIYVVTLFTVGLWFAIGCGYAYLFARLLGAGLRRAVLAALLTGVGTLAFPYATLLVNHVPAGAAAIAAAYHLQRGRDDARHDVVAGLFASLAFAYDAALAVLVVFVVAMLWGQASRRWIAVAIGAAPIVALQLAFNVAVSGAFGPPAMNPASWSDPSSPFHRGDPSLVFFNSPGAYLNYLAYVLIGGKGLLSYTPLVLVCAYGYARMYAEGGSRRRLSIAVAATSAIYVILIVAFTNDYGALNYGERRYVDLFFLLGIGLTPALAAVRGAAGVLVVRALLVVSVAAAALGTVAPFGGTPADSGYVFAAAQFRLLAQRAPVQAVLDVVLLAALVVLLVGAWPGVAVRAAEPRTLR